MDYNSHNIHINRAFSSSALFTSTFYYKDNNTHDAVYYLLQTLPLLTLLFPPHTVKPTIWLANLRNFKVLVLREHEVIWTQTLLMRVSAGTITLENNLLLFTKTEHVHTLLLHLFSQDKYTWRHVKHIHRSIFHNTKCKPPKCWLKEGCGIFAQ